MSKIIIISVLVSVIIVITFISKTRNNKTKTIDTGIIKEVETIISDISKVPKDLPIEEIVEVLPKIPESITEDLPVVKDDDFVPEVLSKIPEDLPESITEVPEVLPVVISPIVKDEEIVPEVLQTIPEDLPESITEVPEVVPVVISPIVKDEEIVPEVLSKIPEDLPESIIEVPEVVPVVISPIVKDDEIAPEVLQSIPEDLLFIQDEPEPRVPVVLKRIVISRVSPGSNQVLTFAEIQFFNESEQVSLSDATVSQSSTFDSNTGPEKAIDGTNKYGVGGKSVSSTKTGNSHWLKLAPKTPVLVTDIKIFANIDASNQYTGVTMKVFDLNNVLVLDTVISSAKVQTISLTD